MILKRCICKSLKGTGSGLRSQPLMVVAPALAVRPSQANRDNPLAATRQLRLARLETIVIGVVGVQVVKGHRIARLSRPPPPIDLLSYTETRQSRSKTPQRLCPKGFNCHGHETADALRCPPNQN
jgi:hypothetical protein